MLHSPGSPCATSTYLRLSRPVAPPLSAREAAPALSSQLTWTALGPRPLSAVSDSLGQSFTLIPCLLNNGSLILTLLWLCYFKMKGSVCGWQGVGATTFFCMLWHPNTCKASPYGKQGRGWTRNGGVARECWVSKDIHQKSEKTIQRMGKDFCKSYI